jgi:hypothetical protein
MNRAMVLVALGWMVLMGEVSAGSLGALGSFRPDAVAVVVLTLALKGSNPFEGLVVTLLLASMLDLLGGGPAGIELVSLTSMFVLAVGLVNRVFLGNLLARTTVGLLLFAFRTSVSVALLRLYDAEGDNALLVLRGLVPSTLATGALFVVAFGPLTQLMARLSPIREERWA